jgi:ATP phosphoribosyltransferase
MSNKTLRIAIQKGGRLNKKSLDLLAKCGFVFEVRPNQLLCCAENYPVEILLVRDDDIPAYVADGICDIGFVGLNVFKEVTLESSATRDRMKIIKDLGFGKCHLAIALPKGKPYDGPKTLEGLKIATSYPNILGDYLLENNVSAQIVEISGSVEVTPQVGVADAICDLVSTGATLASNGLVEVETILESQAVLIQKVDGIGSDQGVLLGRMLERIDGVLKAKRSRYIMMNAPRENLAEICQLIPGMENPTVIPLNADGSKVAIHAVAPENVFWETMEKLKAANASSILVVPIEKIIE